MKFLVVAFVGFLTISVNVIFLAQNYSHCFFCPIFRQVCFAISADWFYQRNLPPLCAINAAGYVDRNYRQFGYSGQALYRNLNRLQNQQCRDYSCQNRIQQQVDDYYNDFINDIFKVGLILIGYADIV